MITPYITNVIMRISEIPVPGSLYNCLQEQSLHLNFACLVSQLFLCVRKQTRPSTIYFIFDNLPKGCEITGRNSCCGEKVKVIK